MNTIAPPPTPPKTFKVRPRTRAFGIALGLLGGGIANLSLFYTAFNFYTRNTEFVPYDTSSPDLQSLIHKKYNPSNNPPVCIDHAVRKVKLEELKTRDQGRLTTEFCRGVWGGMGYAYQRRFLEKKYRALEGRGGFEGGEHLWERKELLGSGYEVGTRITDHFEVVERTPEKVVVRCGDSPLNTAPRPSDGLFSMEVTKDEKEGTATFHLKSVFVDSTPEGKNTPAMPWHMQFAHRLYTKLLMETAIKNLKK